MWKPKLNFISLHYTWIIFCSLLSFPVLYSAGNLTAIDALFFGASGSTESVYIYVIPMITNLMFVNIMVVVARLYWFQQRLKHVATEMVRSPPRDDLEAGPTEGASDETYVQQDNAQEPKQDAVADVEPGVARRAPTITFQENLPGRDGTTADDAVLHIPSPRDRDDEPQDIEAIRPVASGLSRRRPHHADGPAMRAARSVEKVASSVLVLGGSKSLDREPRRSDLSARPRTADLPYLSRQVTVGRNSQFFHLTEEDREQLGGIEYRSLKLLLKINGQGEAWWAFYSAQTMVDNLGFTLTPDSMATFKDATWPMLVMTFLAFAGNTIYPVLLRLVIWVMSKVVSRNSATREHLQFLLDHPRRCYTLLFPSRPTWILFGIVFALNFVDVLLIIVLDLDNPAVNDLPMGPRVLSALFQAASSRHTGTSTLNLSLVSPAVQFSLMCMMYIAIFPIAVSIRASNTYEERALGLYGADVHLDENSGASYIMTHVRNQLSFDLWYIFLGTFCICIAESRRIMDLNEPSFSVFPVFFEVVSAYGNVGLSLGHPSVMTSLSGEFTTFSKLVICAMMIRGRHRGLPYALDRAIMLSGDGRPREGYAREIAQGKAAEIDDAAFLNEAAPEDAPSKRRPE
ncbi:low-affinity potassium transport protein [Colletotrichum plurivorum]|uniref:Low-affinity potassium transport protein n=1 Tax=Colletotrichum plurivorum TaxID=2175906 RepID=A0A8H6MR47_9PEZI|nr:low-affinity potassium transport protein [Colletotrichum plurivorum]